MSPATEALPSPKRILILKPCCIGDVLMATPLARAIHGRWPAATIDWAVDAHSRPVLAGNPHVAELVDASCCIRGDLRVSAWLRTARALRRRQYDAVFVPDRSPLMTLLARATGAPVRVGLASGWRGWAHTVPVPTTPEDGRHESAIYMALASAVGIEAGVDDLRPVFRPSAQDERAAERMLAEVLGTQSPGNALTRKPISIADPDSDEGRPGLRERARIVLHPGGGENPGTHMPSKRWPAERFGLLARHLARGGGRRDAGGRDWAGADVFVVGGPGDRALAARVAATATGEDVETVRRVGSTRTAHAMGKERTTPNSRAPSSTGFVADLAGRLSLGATAALIARCDAYVGNDSGVAHLAAAMGTPVVVLFGPTSAARYGPVPGAGRAVTADPEAIERVPLEMVVAAVHGVLGTIPPPRAR